MKKGTGGIIERALSGAALIGLMMLSLFVGQAFGTTEVYNVPARFTTHTAGQYSSLTQYFRMTCDSVLSVSFFNGWYPGQGTFWAELRDSATGALAWSGSRNTADSLKYKDVGFMVNTGVTRGKTYKLIVGYTYGFGGTDYHLDVYYDSTNAYPYGYMYPYYGNVDLCARVGGVNRIAPDFWGNNWEIGEGCSLKSRYAARAESIGAKWNREWFNWSTMADLKPDSDINDTTYYWLAHDTAKTLTIQHGARMLGVLWATPKWCSNRDSLRDTTSSWPPWWNRHPPKNLFEPVLVNDTINPHNYWGHWVYHVVNRYKGDSVRYWEIWNEENSKNFWRWPATGMGYDPKYCDTTSRDSLFALYDRLVRVAACAAHKADPNAKIFLGGISSVMITSLGSEWERGYDWLKRVYQRPGLKDSLNFISFHDYFPASYTFQDSFNIEIDSLRSLMRANGDTLRPAWLTEFGWSNLGGPEGWKVDWAGQADRLVKAYTLFLARLGNPRGHVDKVQWYNLKDSNPDNPNIWGSHGLIHRDTNKCAWYAQRQHNAKLKNLYFNRIVPRPDTMVNCYEFQIPGPDTALRTWCMWRDTDRVLVPETLSIRTNVAWLVTRDTGGVVAPESIQVPLTGDGSGKAYILQANMDTIPRYLYEVGAVSRPDVIVDSLWIVPTNPKAGEGLRFYARIKNISTTDSLKASITNLVKFQVDGVTKATYQAQRGLTRQGDTLHLDTLTVGYYGNSTNGGESWDRDWTATWGDHLIRAWVDSADKYVELREDNNQGYLFKHIPPKVSVLINSGNEFTNHYTNDTLNLAFNGGTSTPDSMRVKNEGSWGSWITPVVTTYNVDFDPENGDYPRWDSVEVRQGSDAAIGGDSILVDTHPPIATITSPAHGATVSGTITLWGHARDYSADHFRVDTLWYFGDANHHDTIHVSWVPIGAPKQPGVLGTWNTTLVTDGLTQETLAVWDSAGNASRDSITLNVLNYSQTDGGDSWATGFGTYTSPVMNVATDPAGNVYFAETQNSKIRKYSAKKDSLFAFSARRSDSTGLNWAVGMVLKDSAILYVADGYAHAIKAFDRQGNLLLRFGSFGTNAGHFRQPCGIALDHKGRLFVVDRLNHRVQVFSDSSGGFLFQFGSQGQDSGRFNSPTGITYVSKDTALGLTQDLVYISDTRNNQVQVFDSLGNYIKTIKAVDSLGLDTPLGICSDKWGDIFIVDAHHNRIVELNPYGERIFDFGGLGDSLWQFRSLVGIASSPGGRYLYVADAGNRRVTRFTVIRGDTSGGGPQAGAVCTCPRLTSLVQLAPTPRPEKPQSPTAWPRRARSA